MVTGPKLTFFRPVQPIESSAYMLKLVIISPQSKKEWHFEGKKSTLSKSHYMIYLWWMNDIYIILKNVKVMAWEFKQMLCSELVNVQNVEDGRAVTVTESSSKCSEMTSQPIGAKCWMLNVPNVEDGGAKHSCCQEPVSDDACTGFDVLRL